MNSLKSISGLTAATLVVAIISMLYQFILSGILLPSEFAIFSLSLSVVLISGYPAIGMSNEFTRRVKLGEEYRSGQNEEESGESSACHDDQEYQAPR